MRDLCPAARFLVYTPRSPTRRLWLDDREHRFVTLDEADYHFFVRWLWSAKPSRGGRKFYACRTLSTDGVDKSLYLHVEIMKRTKRPPPSPAHTVVDHRNGDSLLCTRENLRWSTPSMNRKNLLGRYPFDLIEDAP
jgi:hypothetical protein